MKEKLWLFMSIIVMPSLLLAQEVGTMADTQFTGHFALHFSYQHLKRDFESDSLREEIVQDFLKGILSYSPSPWVNLYGFVGSSDFPISLADTGQKIHYGGGIKFMLLGGDVYIERQGRGTIHIKGGVGVDFQVGRLQSRDNESYKNFDLTEFQGTIDFGLKVIIVTGYMGFKFSWANGSLGRLDNTYDIKGKGLFSMFLGWSFDLTRNLTFISEFSFFTKKSWALGLRVVI